MTEESKVITGARRLKEANAHSADVRQIQRHKFGFGTNRMSHPLSDAPRERRNCCVGCCVHDRIVRSFALVVNRTKGLPCSARAWRNFPCALAAY